MAVYVLFFREKHIHATCFFPFVFFCFILWIQQASQLSPLPTPKKKYATKNREAIFFGVIHCASRLAWTYRLWRSRHSRRRFPPARARRSWLGRIDRKFFRIFFVKINGKK